MTFFEYQMYITKINTTSSYQALRKLHKQLEELPMVDFYSVHVINKTIKKFKAQTSSIIVKNKGFPIGTSSTHFNYAIQSAESKEQILLLLTDFQGNKQIQFPNHAQSLIHMANLGFTGNEPEFSTIYLSANYYSVGYDSDKGLAESNRVPISIICYLESIKSTELYKTILSTAIDKAKHWNGSKLPKIIDEIDYQIAKQTKQIEALEAIKLIYKEIE